jgi:hypothetical protein
MGLTSLSIYIVGLSFFLLKKKKTIIFLERDLFSKDINELKKQNPDYNWEPIPNSTLSVLSRSFVSPEHQVQTFFKKGTNKKDLENFFVILLNKITCHTDLKCVLDGNIDYWQSYGLMLACNRKNIPFIAISKENPCSQKAYKIYEDRYRHFKFEGTYIASPSRQLAIIFEKLNVAKPENIKVTGYPRLDVYKEEHAPLKSTKNHATIMAFCHKGYGIKDEKSYFNNLKNIIEIIKKQKYNITIKTKNKDDFIKHSKNIPSSPDINLTYTTPISDINKKSVIVIGINSQSVLESLIFPIPIIMPYFCIESDSGYDIIKSEDIKPENGIFRENSLDEFELTFQSLRTTSVLDHIQMSNRLKLLNKFVHFPPQKTSSELIMSLIEENENE